MKTFLLAFCLSLISTLTWAKSNTHVIDEASNGFAIYRTSKPDAMGMRELCRLGITEIMVLSGNAEEFEYKYQADCPTLKVIYNTKQSSHIPVTKEFLQEFDLWVEGAKAEGKKIAFRCNCGCHRTGRLAAYYQMKFQGVSSEDAKIILKEHGKWMFIFQWVYPQVDAISDFIKGKPCSTEEKYCIQN